jgi:hypothetical protein
MKEFALQETGGIQSVMTAIIQRMKENRAGLVVGWKMIKITSENI